MKFHQLKLLDELLILSLYGNVGIEPTVHETWNQLQCVAPQYTESSLNRYCISDLEIQLKELHIRTRAVGKALAAVLLESTSVGI